MPGERRIQRAGRGVPDRTANPLGRITGRMSTSPRACRRRQAIGLVVQRGPVRFGGRPRSGQTSVELDAAGRALAGGVAMSAVIET